MAAARVARRVAGRGAAEVRVAVLAGLERRLLLLAATPYVLMAPVMAVYALDDYRAHPRPGTALWLLVAVPVGAGLLAVLPYGQMVLALGRMAYVYRVLASEMAEIDWRSPRWLAMADELRRSGLDPAAMLAFRVFSARANLTVVHVPSPMPGVWQRMSDWSVDHRRPLLLAGLACGAAAAVWPGLLSWANAPGATAGLVVADCVLVPAAVLVGAWMYRLNIRSARLAVVIPTQWRLRLRADPGVAPLFAHEWSHVRHRDALRRRALETYGRSQWFFVVLTAGGAFGALDTYTDALAAPDLAAIALGIVVMRHVRRSIPLVQEMRADAEACGGDPAGLGAALSKLPVSPDAHGLRERLAALGEDGFARAVRRWRRWLWAGWLGYALPVAAVSAAAIAIRL